VTTESFIFGSFLFLVPSFYFGQAAREYVRCLVIFVICIKVTSHLSNGAFSLSPSKTPFARFLSIQSFYARHRLFGLVNDDVLQNDLTNFHNTHATHKVDSTRTLTIVFDGLDTTRA
jgi:hypothetical protein